VDVAAAVVLRPGGEFLLTQRPAGKVYAGYWEFPGGKIEPGEPAAQALVRELDEELGIHVTRAYPWITREYVYAHAHVCLNFFRVVAFDGEPAAREGQALSWQSLRSLSVVPVLPANGPILRSLALPPVLAITDATDRGESMLLAGLDGALDRGLRMVMVREKQMPSQRLEALITAVAARCRRKHAIVVVNAENPGMKHAGVDGVHLTAASLMRSTARPELAEPGWCGASCHNERELAHAAALGLDYVALGPVSATASHPMAQPLGWRRFTQLIERYPVPVYALGGMRVDDLSTACSAGAHGVAMIRGAWTAPSGQSFPSDWPVSGAASECGTR
jgi:8-oxo-dGTP diphosphatase